MIHCYAVPRGGQRGRRTAVHGASEQQRSAAQCDSVDAGVHHVQGKTEYVTDLLDLLQEFHHDKLAMLLRHQAGARLVAQYDANNTYQYIINREDMQLSWLNAAIAELGGT